jgi:hypothetical protein
MSPSKLQVRLFNSPEGLAIVVTVPARDNVELEALESGKRVIPWSDLSRCAHELSDIVDECVIEFEAALGLGVSHSMKSRPDWCTDNPPLGVPLT